MFIFLNDKISFMISLAKTSGFGENW